jgi:hypothetical protein
VRTGAPGYLEAIVTALMPGARAVRLIRVAARMARDLAVDELVVAGDCWDRGPRADRVVDYLLVQPKGHGGPAHRDGHQRMLRSSSFNYLFESPLPPE